MNKVSIIVPVIYREDLLKVCLDSLIRYTNYPYELIVVWEGNDEKVGKVISEYPQAKVVHNDPRKGFAGAMNSGIKVATGTHYCFLNSDTVVIPGWLDEIMKAFETDGVGLVSPRFTEMEDRRVSNQDDNFEYISDPISLKGVCFVIPKLVIDDVGEWDERFGLGGGDDNDMCLRIIKKYKLIVAKKSYVYHYSSASFREEFNQDKDYAKRYAVTQFNKFKEKNQIKSKPFVFVAVPNQGMISSQLDNCLTFWSHNPNLRVKYHKPEFLYPVDSARNDCVKSFLEEYADYLFFIDADITPPIDVLEKLLSYDKDVVGSLCFSIKEDDNKLNAPFPVAVRKDKEGLYKHYVGKGLERVDATGASCLLIKRKVLEQIERPFYFTYHKNGVASASEDFVFCEQAKQKGFEVWVDFGSISGHLKQLNIKDINDLMVAYGR